MASRFSFRLQRLLDVRRIQEESARTRLAQALAEREVARRLVEEAVKSSKAWDLALEQGRLRESMTGELALFLEGSRYLRKKVELAAEEVGRREAVVEERRENLIESKKRLDSLEKLRERCFSRYQTSMVWSEQRFLDEVGLRNRTGAGTGERRT